MPLPKLERVDWQKGKRLTVAHFHDWQAWAEGLAGMQAVLLGRFGMARPIAEDTNLNGTKSLSFLKDKTRTSWKQDSVTVWFRFSEFCAVTNYGRTILITQHPIDLSCTIKRESKSKNREEILLSLVPGHQNSELDSHLAVVAPLLCLAGNSCDEVVVAKIRVNDEKRVVSKVDFIPSCFHLNGCEAIRECVKTLVDAIQDTRQSLYSEGAKTHDWRQSVLPYLNTLRNIVLDVSQTPETALTRISGTLRAIDEDLQSLGCMNYMLGSSISSLDEQLKKATERGWGDIFGCAVKAVRTLSSEPELADVAVPAQSNIVEGTATPSVPTFKQLTRLTKFKLSIKYEGDKPSSGSGVWQLKVWFSTGSEPLIGPAPFVVPTADPDSEKIRLETLSIDLLPRSANVNELKTWYSFECTKRQKTAPASIAIHLPTEAARQLAETNWGNERIIIQLQPIEQA